MSKHIKVNGKLLQVNKRYSGLKQKQQAKIAGWMYEAFKEQMNCKGGLSGYKPERCYEKEIFCLWGIKLCRPPGEVLSSLVECHTQ